MKIRTVGWTDKYEIDNIYDRFYTANEYPDFFNLSKFPCPFVVTDDANKIILAGGVKTIAEAVVVTDRSQPVRVRQEALLQALGSTIFIAQGMRYKQIHAFVNIEDEKYIEHLQKFGFKLLNAKVLVLDFGESHG